MKWTDIRRHWRPIVFVLSIVWLGGCSQPYVVDQIHMVSALGFDKEGSHYRGSALFPVYEPKERMELTWGAAQTTGLIIAQMQMREDKPLKFGKLRTLLFSKEIARGGIDVFIHAFCRDPLISPLLIAAVSDQPSESILERLEKNGSGKELHKLIKQNITSGNLIDTNLHRFMFDYFGVGRDGFLPYIGMDANKNIEVKGTALFQGDRVALLLDKADSISFKMLHSKYKRGFVPVYQEGDGKVAAVVAIVSGRTDMELRTAGGEKEIVFHSKLSGFLKDQSPSVHIRNKSGYQEMETRIEKQVEKELQSLLAKIQAAGVDPLGIGDFVRARDRTWKEKSFYDDVYRKIRLTVRSKVTLKESGIGS